MSMTLAIRKESGRPVNINNEGFLSDYAVSWVNLKIDRKDPFKLVPVDDESSVDVEVIDSSVCIPSDRLEAMKTGPVEQFRHSIGFTDPASIPEGITVAVWLQYRNGAPRLHEFILGGDNLSVY